MLNAQTVRFRGRPTGRTGKQFEIPGGIEGSEMAGLIAKTSSSRVLI